MVDPQVAEEPEYPPRDDAHPWDGADPFDVGPFLEAPGLEDQTEPLPFDRKSRRKHVKRGGIVSFLVELPVLILVALVVAVLIKTFFVQAFFIPSGSMIPTLEIDDRVMVNKLSYTFGEPDRGDIVVFDSPFAAASDDESFISSAWTAVKESLGIQTALVPDDLIKRIMALPGETIEIRDNTVFIDGGAVDEPYLSPGVIMQDFGPQTIPEDMVFVMGDNRGSSHDSRKFGAIPHDSIVGRAFVLLWPFDRFGSL